LRVAGSTAIVIPEPATRVSLEVVDPATALLAPTVTVENPLAAEPPPEAAGDQYIPVPLVRR
jgi:hypothetical protein